MCAGLAFKRWGVAEILVGGGYIYLQGRFRGWEWVVHLRLGVDASQRWLRHMCLDEKACAFHGVNKSSKI
jgi:hypothetical protein